jgi:hypothetical protein
MAEKKSLFELTVSIVTLIVAGIWAVVVFGHTWQKDTFERETKKYQLIGDFLKACRSNDLAEQQSSQQFFALYSRGALPAGPIVEIFGGLKQFENVGNVCVTVASIQQADRKGLPTVNVSSEERAAAAAAPDPPPKAPDAPSASPSASPNDGERFWIYLGTFSGGKWLTKYLDIPDNFDPAKFSVETDPKKKAYKVRNQPLNVRFGSFSVAGDFPPPTDRPLKPGEQVRIKSAAQWFDSGNWWAIIEPPPSSTSTGR